MKLFPYKIEFLNILSVTSTWRNNLFAYFMVENIVCILVKQIRAVGPQSPIQTLGLATTLLYFISEPFPKQGNKIKIPHYLSLQ